MAEGERAPGGVHRRRLLFIPGYDPRSPGAYHRIWAEEAPKQAAVSGARIEIGPRRSEQGPFMNWTVRRTERGRETETRVTLMRWDDLVRARWLRGPWRTMADVPRYTAALARAGGFALVRRRARPAWLCMITPPVLLGALTLALAAAVLAAALVHPLAGLAMLAAAPWIAAWLWTRIDALAGVGWASQSLSYMAAVAAGPRPEEDARVDLFAERLIGAADEGWADEVVLAGFSQGAAQAVRTLARALEMRPELGRQGPMVNLLTVGQSLCMQSALGDEAFRRALRAAADARHVGWADATSASDPASGCTIHPLEGLLETPDPNRPVRRAPRFHRILEPERFRAVRRNPLAFHFQYLMAADRPGGHDWFALTAGPEPVTTERSR